VGTHLSNGEILGFQPGKTPFPERFPVYRIGNAHGRLP
jgi:hypothetical protein